MIELGKAGKTWVQIAVTLGVCRKTLYNMRDNNPEFEQALNFARDLAQAWLEDVGQTGLFTPGFNATLWNKMVSNRFPDDYTDRSKHDVVKVSMTHEQWLEGLK